MFFFNLCLLDFGLQFQTFHIFEVKKEACQTGAFYENIRWVLK